MTTSSFDIGGVNGSGAREAGDDEHAVRERSDSEIREGLGLVPRPRERCPMLRRLLGCFVTPNGSRLHRGRHLHRQRHPRFPRPRGVWKTRQPVYYQDFMSSEAARIEHWDYKLEGWAAFPRCPPQRRPPGDRPAGGGGQAADARDPEHRRAARRAGTSPERLVEIHGTNPSSNARAASPAPIPNPTSTFSPKPGARPAVPAAATSSPPPSASARPCVRTTSTGPSAAPNRPTWSSPSAPPSPSIRPPPSPSPPPDGASPTSSSTTAPPTTTTTPPSPSASTATWSRSSRRWTRH